MRKTQAKRQRIPRRGPGVAELEKILKEQESGAATDHQHTSSPHTNSTSTAATTTTHPLSLNPPRPPPPPPPPPLVQIMTPSPPPLPRDYVAWSNNLPLFPTLEFIPPPYLPTVVTEKPLFPTTRMSESQLNLAPYFLPSFQYSASSFNPDQYYNPMVRRGSRWDLIYIYIYILFRDFKIKKCMEIWLIKLCQVNVNQGSGSSCPSATSSSAGRHFREIEHPSSQISTDFNNIWNSPEEEEKANYFSLLFIFRIRIILFPFLKFKNVTT